MTDRTWQDFSTPEGCVTPWITGCGGGRRRRCGDRADLGIARSGT